jgi:flagellin
MPQVINTNILSLTAQRNLNDSQGALATSLERLSSGLRINSAKDDAAGLAISERFTTQIRGLNQAIRNANDGISFAQTGEGALSTIGGNLQRIRELAVQSINDTNSSSDRQALNNEVQQLIAEVNRVASSTQFNGQNILDGTLSDLTFQVGANQNQTIQVNGVDARGSQLGARVSESGSISQTNLDASIAADDLVINGIAIDFSGLSAGDSVEDVIGAINSQQADTGVQALKATTVDTGDIASLLATAATADGAMTINGVQVTVVNDGTATGVDLAATAANMNAVSTQTGVTATVAGGALSLSNTSGSTIDLAGASFNTGTAESYSAGIVLAGEVGSAYTVAGTFDVVTGSTALGASQQDNTLNGVDVLTGSNANDALLTLDFALQQVSGLRAELGAVQVRFETTISNLSVSTENLSAARSRIQDADFAKETAELTRAQILQQAGISVLSQANAQPQNVLALLQ